MTNQERNIMCLKIDSALKLLEKVDLYKNSNNRKLDAAISLLYDVKKYCKI